MTEAVSNREMSFILKQYFYGENTETFNFESRGTIAIPPIPNIARVNKSYNPKSNPSYDVRTANLCHLIYVYSYCYSYCFFCVLGIKAPKLRTNYIIIFQPLQTGYSKDYAMISRTLAHGP